MEAKCNLLWLTMAYKHFGKDIPMNLHIPLIPFSERLPDWEVDKEILLMDACDVDGYYLHYMYEAIAEDEQGVYSLSKFSSVDERQRHVNDMPNHHTHWAPLKAQPAPAPSVVVRYGVFTGFAVWINGSAVMSSSIKDVADYHARKFAAALETEVVYE